MQESVLRNVMLYDNYFFKNECIDTAILHYIVHAFYS